MVIALVAGWIVTVIGGYALHWTWTGYSGNTLWDWLQMLLVPLVFPAILLPFLLKWISGNAAERAAMAHEAPVVPPAAGGGRGNIRNELGWGLPGRALGRTWKLSPDSACHGQGAVMRTILLDR